VPLTFLIPRVEAATVLAVLHDCESRAVYLEVGFDDVVGDLITEFGW